MSPHILKALSGQMDLKPIAYDAVDRGVKTGRGGRDKYQFCAQWLFEVDLACPNSSHSFGDVRSPKAG